MDEGQFINSLQQALEGALNKAGTWGAQILNRTLGGGQTTSAGDLLSFIDMNQHAYGRANSAYYKVVRHGNIDYAFAPGVFRVIWSPDDYFFMWVAGFHATPHGTAPEIQLNLLQYIRQEVAKFTPPGVVLDDIVGAPNAATEDPAKPADLLPEGDRLAVLKLIQTEVA